MKTRNIVWVGVVSLFLVTSQSITGWAQEKSNGYRGGDRHRKKEHFGNRGSHEKGDLSARIYRITQADSLQSKKMKPLVDKAAKRIEALRTNFHLQEKKAMDSLRQQLKPILKEDQLKRLEEFKNKDSRKGK